MMMKRIELGVEECEGIRDFLKRQVEHQTTDYDEWLAYMRRLQQLFATAESVS